MLSRNNKKEYFYKQRIKAQHFTIKKLTIGVASVLIGLTFMGNEAVNADSNASYQNSNTTSTTKSPNNVNTDQAVISDDSSQATSTNAAAIQQSVTNIQKQAQINQKAVTSAKATASQINSKEVINSTNVKTPQLSVKNLNKSNSEMQTNISQSPSTTSVPIAENKVEALNENAQTVSNWAEFINALSDTNITTINLNQNITVTGKVSGLGGRSLGYNGCLTLNGKDIARKVIINGNNNTIDFGHFSLMPQDNNQRNGESWDITLNNVVINGVAKDGKGSTSTTSPGSFGLISFENVNADNQKKDTITLNNVSGSVTDRPIIEGAHGDHSNEYYTLIFKGNNNFTNQGYTRALAGGDNGSAFDAGYFSIENDTTTINMTRTGSNPGFGGNAIRVAQYDLTDSQNNITKYAVNVAKDATLNIGGIKNSSNIKSSQDLSTCGDNVRGILEADGTHGTVHIAGNLNMNLGGGHSIAIFGGNLVVEQSGSIDITTQQNQTGLKNLLNWDGGQYGVLSIGVGNPQNLGNAGKNIITDNGSIKIVRTSTANTFSPIISMGSGTAGNNSDKFIININPGATLDLQDSIKQTKLGMIYVSGSSVNDEVNFNQPKYVNLQRLNNQTVGQLIYLEGAPSWTNTITGTIPVAQWQQDNFTSIPNFAWSIRYEQSINNWGNYAGSGFTQAGNSVGQGKNGVEKFLNSSGTVIMGGNQAGKDSFQYNGMLDPAITAGTPTNGDKYVNYYSPYLNQFLNYFSWWTPQRLAMGTQLIENPKVITESDKYQPEVQTITGNTTQTLDDLDPKTGIKDLIILQQQSNGELKAVISNDLSPIKSVTWYNAADDETAYKKAFGSDATLPNNPTGNLKTTDTSAWAKVTYSDGSIDFVNIPLKINDPLSNISTGNLWFWKGSHTLNQLINKLKSTPDGVSYNKLSIYFRNLFANPVVNKGYNILYSLTPGTTSSDFNTDQVGYITPENNKPLLHVEIINTDTKDIINQTDLSFGLLILEQPQFNAYEVPLNYGFNANDDIKNILANYKNAIGYPIGINWIHQPDTSKPGYLSLQEQIIYNTGNPANGFGKLRLPAKQIETIDTISVAAQADFTPMVVKGTDGSVEAEVNASMLTKKLLLSRQNVNEQFVTNQAGLLVNQAGTAFVSAQPATTLTVKKATKTLDATQLKALLNTSLLQTTGLPYQLNGDALKLTGQTVEGKVKVQVGNQDNHFDLYVPVQASLKVVPDTSESATINETPSSSSAVAPVQPVTSAQPTSSAVVASDVPATSSPASQTPASSTSARPNSSSASSEVTKPEQPTVPTSTAAPVQSAATSAEQPSQAPVSSAVTSGIINEPSASSSAVAPAQPVTSAQPTSSAVVASDVPATSSPASQTPASSTSARPNSSSASSEVTKPEQPTVPTSTAAPVQSAAASAEQPSQALVSSAVTSEIINEPSASSSAVAPAQPVTSAQPTSSAVVASDIPATSSPASQAPASSTSARPNSSSVSSEITKLEQSATSAAATNIATSVTVPVQSVANEAKSAVTVTKVVSNSNTRLTTSSVSSHSQVINPLQINANLGQIANHEVKVSSLQPQSKVKQEFTKTNQTLPQTGDDNSKAVLGLGLGSLIAMFSLINPKRSKIK